MICALFNEAQIVQRAEQGKLAVRVRSSAPVSLPGLQPGSLSTVVAFLDVTVAASLSHTATVSLMALWATAVTMSRNGCESRSESTPRPIRETGDARTVMCGSHVPGPRARMRVSSSEPKARGRV
jgi:hypothetical protein